MPEGRGEAEAHATPEAAFRYLADPRHAAEWFAAVALAAPPEGPPRAGQTWRFTPTRATRGGEGPLALCMAAYEPPRRFTWATARRWPRTALAWTVECLPVTNAPDRTWLRVALRMAPGPLGWLALLLTFGRTEQSLARRAQAAADRAAQTLTDLTDATRQQRDQRKDDRRQGTKRAGRRR